MQEPAAHPQDDHAQFRARIAELARALEAMPPAQRAALGVELSGLAQVLGESASTSRAGSTAEQHILLHNAILAGINRVFEETITCETEQQLGQVCLAVAEELTGSQFGFIAELNQQASLLNCLVISDPGWEVCRVASAAEQRELPAFAVHGLYGHVVLQEQGFFSNEPSQHPAALGLPEGHPPLTAFLGVPILHGRQVVGMLGLGNRPGGYSDDQLEAASALAPAIWQSYLSKRAEIALRDAHAEAVIERNRLMAIMEALPVGIIIADKKGENFHFNAKFERMWGSPHSSVQTAEDMRKYKARWLDSDREVAPEDCATFRALAGETVSGQSFEIERFDGKRLPVLNSGEPMRDDQGQIIGSVAAFMDISDLRAAEVALQNNQRVLSLFVEHAPAAIAMLDTQMCYLAASRRYLRDYHIPGQPADILGRSHYDLFPEIPERWKEIHRRCLAGATEKCDNDPFPRSDGRLDWVRWEVHPWFTNAGSVGGILIFSEVITDFREAERNARLQAQLIKLSYEPIFTWDTQSGIQSWNEGCERLYSFTRAEALGRSSHELLQTHHPIPFDELFQQLLTTGRWTGEIVHTTKDGRKVIIASRHELIHDGDRQIVLEVNKDISEQRAYEEQLKFQARVLENVQDAVLVIDRQQRITYWNRSAEKMYGYQAGEALGCLPDTLFQPEIGQAGVDEIKRRLIATGEAELELVHHTKDGRRIWVDVRSASITADNGQVIGYISSNRDITDRHVAEAALAESNQRFRITLSASEISVFTTDRDLRYTWLHNPLYGLNVDAMLCRRDDEVLPAEETRELLSRKQAVIDSGQGWKGELRIRLNGQPRTFILAIEPLRAENGQVSGLVGAALDATQQRQAETEHREALTKMEIQRRLMEQREKDRQAIARDIHDGPVQTLASIGFNLQFVKEAFPDPALRLEMEQISLGIRGAIQELRQVINDLRPPSLIRFGLAKAIRVSAEELRDRHAGPQWELDLADDQGRLPETVCLTLYRIFQEAANNILRHSGASKAQVRFQLEGEQASLEISDNGRGFAYASNMSSFTEQNHFGLAGMRERAEAIGGTLEVTTQEGAGTFIRVLVRLPKSPKS